MTPQSLIQKYQASTHFSHQSQITSPNSKTSSKKYNQELIRTYQIRTFLWSCQESISIWEKLRVGVNLKKLLSTILIFCLKSKSKLKLTNKLSKLGLFNKIIIKINNLIRQAIKNYKASIINPLKNGNKSLKKIKTFSKIRSSKIFIILTRNSTKISSKNTQLY